MGRLIDADKLSADMYHEAFEKDSDMQKWDSGCWIRYKMFENVLKAQPTVQPNTTTNDSISAEAGKNDGDRTSGDCISRTQAIDTIKKRLFETAFNNIGIKRNVDDTLLDVAEDRLETWFDDVPSIQPEIIHCKDCKHWNTQLKTADGNGLGSCDFHNVNLVTSEGFCYWAERREDAID